MSIYSSHFTDNFTIQSSSFATTANIIIMPASLSAPSTPVKGGGTGHDDFHRQLATHEVDKFYQMRTHKNGHRSFLVGWKQSWIAERDLPMGALELRDRFVMAMAPKSVTVNTMATPLSKKRPSPKKDNKLSPAEDKPPIVHYRAQDIIKKKRPAVAIATVHADDEVHGCCSSKRFKPVEDVSDDEDRENYEEEEDYDDRQQSPEL